MSLFSRSLQFEMTIAKVVITLIIVWISIKFFKWYKQRRRLVQAIERLPGPPNVPYSPLNHAAVVVFLDLLQLLLQHKIGTYTLAYYMLSTVNVLYPDIGLCRIWLAFKPIVIVYSPENVETILTSSTVIDKGVEYKFLKPWIGEGLITSGRAKWRFRRKIITPAFHFRILNDFLPIMNQEATKLIQKLNQNKYLGTEQAIDMAPLIALCTLDTICETAMGVNINCQRNEHSPYVQALYEVVEMVMRRVSRPWLWYDFIFYLTKDGKRFIKARDIMHKFTTKVIIDRKAEWEHQLKLDSYNLEEGSEVNFTTNVDQQTRRESLTMDNIRDSSFFGSGNKRLAFLDLMLQQHLIDQTLSIEDIQEEVDTFMFAGHDTTAVTCSWTLYMLGLHPDIQDRVREELDRVMAMDRAKDYRGMDRICSKDCQLAEKLFLADVSVEQIREMKYLDRVIKETLRLWPSAPFVSRKMTEDLLLGNKYLVPKGATCMLFMHMLHNNPKYYPKPHIFDPDRFLPENLARRHPFAYIPFSAGPRNCIGQKYALMEIKVILAKVLLNYLVKTVDHRDKLQIVGEVVLRSRNGINVKLYPRFPCCATKRSSTSSQLDHNG